MLIFPLGKRGTSGIPVATIFICVACLLVAMFATTLDDRLALAFYPDELDPLKMFTCDYQDLVKPQEKKHEQATPFIGSVTLHNVELLSDKCFTEMYASNPEPKIPVWITYHWKVFRAKDATAKLSVSDWPSVDSPVASFGQEQTFNFLELQPYWE